MPGDFPPPLLPLPVEQRLWHIPMVPGVRCREAFARFTPGSWYRITREAKAGTRTSILPDGQRWKVESRETSVLVWPETGTPAVFMLTPASTGSLWGCLEGRPLADLWRLFDIPEIPTVSDLCPDAYHAARSRLPLLLASPRPVRPLDPICAT